MRIVYARNFSGLLAAAVLTPSTVLAASGGEHGAPGLGTLLFPFLNFVLYSALIVFLYRKLARPALRDKSVEVSERIRKAHTILADAEREYEGLDARLRDIATEKKEVITRLITEGERTAAKVLTSAQEAVESMRTDTARRIGAELKRAESEVRFAVVREATTRAKEQLQRELSAEDDLRLRREALRTIR